MSEPVFHHTLDARGLSCPMPIVRARQELGKLQPGQVLKVVATDRGSIKDFQGWARASQAVRLVGQETVTEDGTQLYIHYVEKVS